MTKSDRLYGELKNRIIGCEPGSAFYSFRTIMNDYSVSQATVTAATRRLIDEGLLKPNTGKEMEITDEVLKYRQDAPPVVCLAMPHWQSDWYTFIEHHFFDLASELGYQLEVLRYDWRIGVPESLPQTKIDALVLVADSQKLTAENIRRMNQYPLPYVIFARDLAGIAVNCVGLDNEYAGAKAAHHLIELGHRSLAVAVSQPKSESIFSRIKGFRQFCELHGVGCEVIDCDIRSGDFSPEKVYRVLRERFAAGRPGFTGLFTLCEDSASGIYRACFETGLRIPQELSVVAIGQSWRLDYFTPALTALGTDISEMVRQTIRILKSNLAASSQLDYERKLVKPQLTVRNSTAAFAAAK